MSEVPIHRATSVDGTEIAFTEEGAGDPLLLVHGSLGDATSWVMLTPQLVEQFTVVTMDRRGRGASGDGDGYSLDLEAADVAAVIDAIGAPVHLVGHSFGARVSLLAAARGADLRSLTVYEPPLTEPEGAELPDGVEALVRAGDRPAAVELFLSHVAQPEEIELIKGFPPAWERILGTVPTLAREIRAVAAGAVDLDLARRIDVPTLVLVGGETTTPRFLEGLDEIERAIPDARRVVLPGQRHVAQAFAPELFAEAVGSFVTSVAGAPERP